ncbi:tRNA-intron lyase [Candidatus Pacearchaeota archaeon CG10_big_fil_rev_8_21_14_0_10_31_24]|nr:MAG: tRNA-intron lyase [Candidatus Pacearchaeota archaeon CG10_big_fil_rev_8_21_14_0_10_31_24]
MINASFSSEKITSTSPDAFSLYEKSRFGEKKEKVIEYSPIETLFLIKQNKLEISINSKPISEEESEKKLKKLDKKILTKLEVYSDLRKRGYILKTALKFGADFRIYEKGVKPGEDHAIWLLYITKSNESINWTDFAAKNRVAHSAKKNLLIAILDEEGDVSYYQISWLKP